MTFGLPGYVHGWLKKQVRVLAVKKSRVECVIADQPEFQKRPFSDYQVGDLVEGTVITVRERAAFVDVGAMQQGYLPEENVKGQKLEEGQKIKLKGETVTGCRMTLVVPTNSTAETLPVEAAGGWEKSFASQQTCSMLCMDTLPWIFKERWLAEAENLQSGKKSHQVMWVWTAFFDVWGLLGRKTESIPWRTWNGKNGRMISWWFKVTFLGWLSDPFKGLGDLQLGDKKVTLNHLIHEISRFVWFLDHLCPQSFAFVTQRGCVWKDPKMRDLNPCVSGRNVWRI